MHGRVTGRQPDRSRWHLPIAGGADEEGTPPAGNEPQLPAEPLSVEEQVAQALKLAEEARERAARVETEAGHLRVENQNLRMRLDAREAMGYRPAVSSAQAGGVGGPVGEDDSLTKFLIDGLDETERAAPTAETVARLIGKSGLVVNNLITDRLVKHEKAKELDEAFFEFLADRWQKSRGRAYQGKDLARRHLDRVRAISQAHLLDRSTGAPLPQYVNNPEATFQRVAEELERELNLVSEDVQPHGPPRARLSTGDAGGSRLPSAPDRRTPSQQEMDSLRRYSTGR
jgi:regulator of replication initiation timing